MEELKQIIINNGPNAIIAIIAGIITGYVVSSLTGKSRLSTIVGVIICAIVFIMLY